METYGYPIPEKYGILVVYSRYINLPVKVWFAGQYFYANTMHRKNSKGAEIICAIFPSLNPGRYNVYVNDELDHAVTVYPALTVETNLTLV